MVYFIFFSFFLLELVFQNCVINFAINGPNDSFNKNIPDDNSNKQVEDKRVKRSIVKNKKFIWTLPIDYHISKKLGKNAIEEAIKKIQEETCVTFNKSTRHIRLKNGINFKYDTEGCSSYVGKRKEEKPQSILLDDDCKNHLGALIHEISHALGLNHEQSRRDRNNYITVIRKNIEKDERYNVAYDRLHNSQTFGISYDLSSIMHYNIFAFSSNGLATLVPLDQNYNFIIGQENDYTFNDAKLINYLYCNDTCENATSLNCENYGYQDPKNCSQCRCPHGFAGTNCDILQPQSDQEKCGTHYYYATHEVANLTKTGIMNCTFLIKSESGVNVRIKVTNLVASPAPDPRKFLLCFSRMGLEIKHRIDTSVTGLCLCGKTNKTITINSEGDEVFILWYGKQDNHTFTLTYEEF